MDIDLRRYVIAKWGKWIENADAYRADVLRLEDSSDGVTLVGPLRVEVAVTAINHLHVLGSSSLVADARDVFCYVLEIPPGQSWSYAARGPQVLVEAPDDGSGAPPVVVAPPERGGRPAVVVATPGGGAPAVVVTPPGGGAPAVVVGPPSGSRPVVVAAPPPAGGGTVIVVAPPPPHATPAPTPPPRRRGEPPAPPPPAVVAPAPRPTRIHVNPPPLVGTNAGFGVTIRPAGPFVCRDVCAPDPCKPVDPCAPKARGCGGCRKTPCECGGKCGCNESPCRCGPRDGAPCDFAVANHPNLGWYFPSACEPCTPGASIGMPPQKGASLVVPPAAGGTVRTRYYDGMYITKEDLETDWRNARLKRSLTNRAMGQGVVWGFSIGRDGHAICVMPGYGVDCCGNDVVLSTPYRVDVAGLLRDPAAAPLLSKGGPQRMHLLLEYYECPEQPRPVHGDPCAPDASRCEMSRIRETARLRLVPPCDVDDSGPIKDFLAEIAQLRAEPSTASFFEPSAAPVAAPALQVPFDVFFERLDEYTSPSAPEPRTATLQPKLVTDTPALVRTDIPLLRQGEISETLYGRVRVTLKAKSGFTFTQAQVVRTRIFTGGTVLSVSQPVSATRTATEISWVDINPDGRAVPGAEPIPASLVFEVQGWVMRDASGGELLADRTEIDLTTVGARDWPSTPWGKNHPTRAVAVLHLQVQPTDVRARAQVPPSRWPCASEACDPTGAPRFATAIPFLHGLPSNPKVAADPRVIMLAILYAWLASEQARAPQDAASIARLQAAQAIFANAARVLLGTSTTRGDLTTALQRLIQAWCKGFLYPGPKCTCEPHGVVIGCALVEGGEIRTIDPWGGRRWVVHYPLLAHWGQQFGIMPLDAVASKVFDMICCIASLPRPDVRPGTSDWTHRAVATHETPPARASAPVPLGTGVLLFDDAAVAMGRLAAMGMKPTRTETLSPLDFVARVRRAMEPTAGGAEVPLVHYRVRGLAELHFVAPAETPPAPVAPPVIVPRVPAAGRVAETVRATVIETPSVPPLLRDFTETLSRDLIATLPVEDERLAEALGASGVLGSADLLEHDPESLARSLRPEDTQALAEILAKADANARTLTRTVSETVTSFWGDRRIVSREGLTDEARASEFAKMLVDRLKSAKIKVTTDTVVTAVRQAARARG